VIVSRTPFRLSFAGGGSDLPSFFQEEEGAVLSTALNKYMYITANTRFDQSVRLSYSKTEICETVEEIEHPIFKNVLKKYAPQGGVELISMADIPSGSGLGSSSSFTVGLLHALKGHLGKFQTAEDLAKESCDIEINQLHEPIGKQDQYIAAYGGLQFIRFLPNGETHVDPIVCSSNTRKKLEASCLLFFTGKTRNAKDILAEQKNNTNSKRENLRDMVLIARKMKVVLEKESSLETFGRLLDEAWQIKRGLASNVSNASIDGWYSRALKAGAWGGKILGAGSGGFLMLFCDPAKRLKVCEELKELRTFDCGFDSQGSKIIFMG
jgi:D-glycero-alpha-D-manno-heptose-7-phosphate kinase